MAYFKIGFTFLVCFVTVLSLEFVTGAPAPDLENVLSNKRFVEKFSEFLHEDKNAAEALSKFLQEEEEAGNEREKRAVTTPIDLDEFVNEQEQQGEKPGFFDRAAKFVMDLLQRFLKWINTDNN